MAIDDHTVLILGGCGGPNLVSMISLFLYLSPGSKVGTEVWTITSHKCGQCSSYLSIDAIRGLGSFFVLSLALRGFSLTGYSGFPIFSSYSLFLLLPIIGRLEKWGLQLQCLTLTTTTTNFALTTTRKVSFGLNYWRISKNQGLGNGNFAVGMHVCTDLKLANCIIWRQSNPALWTSA